MGYEEIAQLLLVHEADVNLEDESDKTSFVAALTSPLPNNYKIVKLLAACEGMDPGYCISLAAVLGKSSTLRAIIQGLEARRDVNVTDAINATDALGRTGIAYASRVGNAEVIECLLEQEKANIAKPDLYGNMPLDAAVRNGHYEVVETLFTNGARLCDTNDLANTSLLGWARLGHDNDNDNDIARLLKSQASVAGGSLRDDPAPAGYERVHVDAREAWCDVCTLTIATNAVYYVCRMCNQGGLVVCYVCWRQGFTCLNAQHVLLEHKVEATAG